jgi:hypothetical protein
MAGTEPHELQLQLTAQRPSSAPHNRELASLINAHKQQQQRRRPGSSGGSRGSSGSVVEAEPRNPNTTTYNTSYNVRDEHPELYAK